MPLFKPWNLIHTSDIRELLSCWRSCGGAQSIKGWGREKCRWSLASHIVFLWHDTIALEQCSVCVCECARVCEGVQGCARVFVTVQLCAHSCLCRDYSTTRCSAVPCKAWPWISQVKMLLCSLKLNQIKVRDFLCIQNHLLLASSSHEPPKMQKELYQCLWSL